LHAALRAAAAAADAAQVQVWQEARLPAIAAPLLQAMCIIAAKVLIRRSK